MSEPDPPVSVTIDISAHVDGKRAASAMHRSQFGENSMFARIPDDLRNQFYGEERFYQARPGWPGGLAATKEFPPISQP